MNNFEVLPSWAWAVYVFIFGLCTGSFLNVVILRGLSGEDFIFERSKCPKCQTQLKWYMNIPVLSYIFLRGKCAYCKEKISPQYPIIELITAILFLAIYFMFGLTLKSLFMCIITSALIALCVTDILETVIITNHAIFLSLIGIISSFFDFSQISTIESILSGILGFIIFEAISRLGYLFANMRMFGQGDSYIVLAIGTIFGYKGALITVAVSFLLQSIIAIPAISYTSFKERKIQLGISYIIIVLSIIYIFIVNFTSLINESYHLYSAISISLLLIYCLFNIINEINLKKKILEKRLDENNEDDFETGKKTFTLLPFGPALIIASMLYMFFGDYIKKMVSNFLF